MAFAVTGTADQEDRLTMDMVIAQENARRAALTPPLPALPNTTAVERRQSYQTAIARFAVEFHASKVAEFKATRQITPVAKQIRQALALATPAQQQAALTALTT